MKRITDCLTLVATLTVLGCAHAPRPAALDRSQVTAESEGATFSKKLAPQAFARAEGLRLDAEAALADGHDGVAAALAEQALVAFERAALEARKVDALRRIAAAEQESQTRRAEVAKLVALQTEIAEETKRLELRVEIETNAIARPPLSAEAGARAAARAESSRSLLETARLLCAAARLLGPDDAESKAQLGAVEALLATSDSLPPHDALTRAMDQRVACLASLTKLKRKAARSASDPGDELLASLSPSFADLRPHRDDRGVVLSARQAWDGRELTASGRDVVDRVGKLVASRQFPVMVVLHPEGKPGTEKATLPVMEHLKRVFPNASVILSTTRPSALASLPAAKDTGRVEFIFVTP